nr:MAG TPA: hypothetical protein [Caudoviricetes sp.]
MHISNGSCIIWTLIGVCIQGYILERVREIRLSLHFGI